MTKDTGVLSEWTERVAASAGRYAEIHASDIHKYSVLSGSPIEQAFHAALLFLLPEFSDDGVPIRVLKDRLTMNDVISAAMGLIAMGEPPTTVIGREVSVSGYRVDFLVVVPLGHLFPTGSVCCIAVECDGHEFHDRTKDQASADRARDRKLQAEGVKVFRFTGSDIWRDCVGCAKEVLEYAAQEHWHGNGGLRANIDPGMRDLAKTHAIALGKEFFAQEGAV